jgi:hypothetical protein
MASINNVGRGGVYARTDIQWKFSVLPDFAFFPQHFQWRSRKLEFRCVRELRNWLCGVDHTSRECSSEVLLRKRLPMLRLLTNAVQMVLILIHVEQTLVHLLLSTR